MTDGAGDTMTNPLERHPELSAIVSERRQLVDLAYRLLGSLAEAEVVVQETYIRWYTMSEELREATPCPIAWLAKVASRICLDLLGSPQARRERHAEDAIPESDQVTLDESITTAFLVILESMAPAERVAFILHDVFQYSVAEVAEITGRTPGVCRRLAASARQRVHAARVPLPPPIPHLGQA